MNNPIKIAIRLNGGIGTNLIQINAVNCFFNKTSDCKKEISIYGNSSDEINEALFKRIPCVHEYYNRNLFETQQYDLALDLRFFFRVVSYKPDVLIDYPSVNAYVKKWINFENNVLSKTFFEYTPLTDYNIYTYMIANSKNRFNVADVDNTLQIGDEYSFDLSFDDKVSEEYLSSLELVGKKYITIQRGSNVGNHVNESPKNWPLEYYNQLTAFIKKKYPEYKIVQIGNASEESTDLNNIDINLVGQTTLEQVMILLKKSNLHIDGEGGMVHLRKAVHGGVSIVLFGPTPVDIFGYKSNYNLRKTTCKMPCASLFDAWQRKCLIFNRPICMYDLKPKFVMQYVDKCMKQEYPNNEEKTVLGKLLDENIVINQQWIDNWLGKRELYGYSKIKQKLGSLYCNLFNGSSWTRIKLDQHPAYLYFMGK